MRYSLRLKVPRDIFFNHDLRHHQHDHHGAVDQAIVVACIRAQGLFPAMSGDAS